MSGPATSFLAKQATGPPLHGLALSVSFMSRFLADFPATLCRARVLGVSTRFHRQLWQK
jgi:hypothetical protein